MVSARSIVEHNIKYSNILTTVKEYVCNYLKCRQSKYVWRDITLFCHQGFIPSWFFHEQTVFDRLFGKFQTGFSVQRLIVGCPLPPPPLLREVVPSGRVEPPGTSNLWAWFSGWKKECWSPEHYDRPSSQGFLRRRLEALGGGGSSAEDRHFTPLSTQFWSYFYQNARTCVCLWPGKAALARTFLFVKFWTF